MARQLSDTERLVNWVRAVLGMYPLYGAKKRPCASGGDMRGPNSYAHYERLRKRANPRCGKCEGSGYQVGAAHDADLICACVDSP